MAKGSESVPVADFRGGVFISYRRKLDEKAGYAEKLAVLLKERIGEERVFFDDHSIRSGDKFKDLIIPALRAAQAIVFVISPGWVEEIIRRGADSQKLELSETGADLDEINDWVLREAQIVAERLDTPTCPPDIHPLLVGGAEFPDHETLQALPQPIRKVYVAIARARALPIEWDSNSVEFQELAVRLEARLPRQSGADMVEVKRDTLVAVRNQIDVALENWQETRVLCEFWRTWGSGAERLKPETAIDALLQLQVTIRALGTQKQLAGSSIAQCGTLKADLQSVVVRLFRLGACELASKLDDFGDMVRTAPFHSLAAQLSVVASRQNRSTDLAQIPSEKSGVLKFDGAWDQETLTAGIFDDKEKNILLQIWRNDPLHAGESPPFEGKALNDVNADEVDTLATELNLRSRAGMSRVTVGIQHHEHEPTDVRRLRELMVRLKLDVEVLARSGNANEPGSTQEKELLVAASRCLKQIDITFNESIPK